MGPIIGPVISTGSLSGTRIGHLRSKIIVRSSTDVLPWILDVAEHSGFPPPPVVQMKQPFTAAVCTIASHSPTQVLGAVFLRAHTHQQRSDARSTLEPPDIILIYFMAVSGMHAPVHECKDSKWPLHDKHSSSTGNSGSIF